MRYRVRYRDHSSWGREEAFTTPGQAAEFALKKWGEGAFKVELIDDHEEKPRDIGAWF